MIACNSSAVSIKYGLFNLPVSIVTKIVSYTKPSVGLYILSFAKILIYKLVGSESSRVGFEIIVLLSTVTIVADVTGTSSPSTSS